MSEIPEGLCPIHVAAWSGNVDALRAIMTTGKVPIDYPDKYGNTAIHYATYRQHFDFVKTCTEEFKANLLLFNNGSQSALSVMNDTKLALVPNEDWTVEWAMAKGKKPI